MRALTVLPGTANSAAVTEVDEPDPSTGSVLVQGLFMGVCGTDLEISHGDYGTAPAGHERLVIGHESLGRVLEAPDGSGFAAGDLIVGVVRRPDPVPCASCAAGEWDMCKNGQYVERGIKGLDGYASERWRVQPEFALKLDPSLADNGILLEPTSVVAKAWDVVERIGARGVYQPRTALITGAGPIGMLAALLGVQKGLDVHVLDQMADGPKPDLVRALGATYHHGDIKDLPIVADVVIECTGVGALVFGSIDKTGPDGIICLTGVSPIGRDLGIDAGALNREIVLQNEVIVGSVNANLRHYHLAGTALAAADPEWLSRLVTRKVPLDNYAEALVRQPDDIKVAIAVS